MAKTHTFALLLCSASILIVLIVYYYDGTRQADSMGYTLFLSGILTSFFSEPESQRQMYFEDGFTITEIKAMFFWFCVSATCSLISLVLVSFHRLKVGFTKLFPALFVLSFSVTLFSIFMSSSIGLYN